MNNQETTNSRTVQTYMWPCELFTENEENTFWTCVRTKPRWEKRFSRWLRSKNIPHFLPVFEKTTTSHRKTRTTEIPVIPSYVFVQGNRNKTDFQYSGCVAYIIKPSCAPEASLLDAQLRDIWCSLNSGMLVVPIHEFISGEKVEVVDGPLQGTRGQFVRNGKHGTLIISIELLGSSAAVELTADSHIEPLESPQHIAY